jgi:hypothetical protein
MDMFKLNCCNTLKTLAATEYVRLMDLDSVIPEAKPLPTN